MSESSQFPNALQNYEIVTRHIVMERHLNAHGNLFGGVVLAWLDEAAALYVMELAGYSNFVTVSMDDVSFKSPGHRGDCLVIYCRTVKIGRSSITVQAQAWVHEPQSLEKHLIIECSLTFVCLKEGKAFPYFVSEEYLSWCNNKTVMLPE
ncbi:MAG: acyl-CoA thioesterase [Deltaproteobacteria bacterium]|nr:MAG: acyl-CoA thioesterase [Deltaproteobacteria bacterium]